MWYLFIQMWLWILLSFIAGWFAHWYLCCKRQSNEHEKSYQAKTPETVQEPIPEPSVATLEADADTQQSEPTDDWKPAGFAEKPTGVDDLKRIRGIGKVNERALQELGIYQFAQIALWTEENVKWIEGFLAFPGRISREEWVEQAKKLERGEATEFAKKVDQGMVDYDN